MNRSTHAIHEHVAIIVALLMVGALAITGCSKKSETEVAPQTTTEKAAEAVKKGATATRDATGRVLEKSGEGLEKAGESLQETGEKMQQ